MPTNNNNNYNNNSHNAYNVPVGTTYGLDLSNPHELKNSIKDKINEMPSLKDKAFQFAEVGSALSISNDGLVIFIVPKQSWTPNVDLGITLKQTSGCTDIPMVVSIETYNSNPHRILSLFQVTAGLTKISVSAMVTRNGNGLIAEDYYSVISSGSDDEFMAVTTTANGNGLLSTIAKGKIGICWNAPTTINGIMPQVSPNIKKCFYLTDIVSSATIGNQAVDETVDTLKAVKTLISMIGALGMEKNRDWLSDHVGLGISFRTNDINGLLISMILAPSTDGYISAFDDLFFYVLKEMGIDILSELKEQKTARLKLDVPMNAIEERSFEPTVFNIKMYDDYTPDNAHLNYIKPRKGKDVITAEGAKHIPFIKNILQLASLGRDVVMHEAVNVTQNGSSVGVAFTATVSPIIMSLINKALKRHRNQTIGGEDILSQTTIEGYDPSKVSIAGASARMGYAKSVNIFADSRASRASAGSAGSASSAKTNNGVGI